MKRSTIATVVLLGAYLTFAAVVISAVAETSGGEKDTFSMLVAVLGLTIFLILLATNKSIDGWLKGLDRND